jgi:hypothetical protein
MYAVEFEAQVHNHAIIVPDAIPEGADIRVLLLLKDTQLTAFASSITTNQPDPKHLLMSLTEGLSDQDLARPRDIGRDVL